MLATSEEILTAWLSPARQLAVRVQVDQSSYGSEDVASLSFDSGSISGEVYQIGSTYMNTVQIVFPSIIETIKEDQEVIPELGILVDGEYHYSKLGHFFITEFNRDRNAKTTTITASDKMIYMEGAYESKLTYSKSYREVALEIANLAGVEINQASFASLGTLAIKKPVGYTHRQAIGLIAQFEGGFASFNRDGELEIRRLRPTDFEVTPESYLLKGFSKNENAYRIGGITVRIGEEETDVLRVGSTNGSQIELENKVMTQTLLNNIWDLVKNLNYFPFELKWRGCPLLEAGDWMYVADRDGKRYSVPNLSYNLNFNGGLSGDSKATTNSSSQATYKYRGTLKQRVDWLDSILSANDWNSNYYDTTTEPKNPKPGDLWFKREGDIKTILIYAERDGQLGWYPFVSTETENELAEKVEAAVKKAEEAKNVAEENYQKSVEETERQVAEESQKWDDQLQKVKAEIASDISETNQKSEQALNEANQATIKADQSVVASNQAKTDSLTALGNADQAKENANTALTNSVNAINDAKNALDQYASLSFDSRNLLLDTAVAKDVAGTGAENQLRTLANLSKPTFGAYGFEIGKSVAFRVTTEISGSGFAGTFHFRLGSSKWVQLNPNGARYPITKAETVTFEVVIPIVSGWEANRYVDIRLDNVPSTVNLHITEMQLTYSSEVLPWARAPEDVQVSIENLGNELQLKVNLTIFNELSQTVSIQETAIKENAKEIELKANQTTVNALTGRVTNAEGSISTMAGQIELKANQSTVNSLTGRVTTAEGSIKTMAGQIELKAEKSYVDTVKNSVDDVRSDLTVEAGKISALNTLTNGHTTQIGNLQSSYEGLSSTVSKVDQNVNGFSGNVNLFSLKSAASSTVMHPTQPAMPMIEILVDKDAYYTVSTDYPNRGTIDAPITDAWFIRATSTTPNSVVNGVYAGRSLTLPAIDTKIYIVFRTTAIRKRFLDGDYHLQVERGKVATDWTPSASDTATVIEFSNLIQTVNVIQGTVANKAEQSQVTQLAGQIQSLVSDRRKNLFVNSDFREGLTGWTGTGMSTMPIANSTETENNKIGYQVQKYIRPTMESMAGANAYPIQTISNPESYKGKKLNVAFSYVTLGGGYTTCPIQAVIRYTLDGTNYYVTFTGRTDYNLDISSIWKRVNASVDFTNIAASQSLSDIRISISIIASRFTTTSQRCALTAFMATEDGNMYQWGYEYGTGVDYAQTTVIKDLIDLRVEKDGILSAISLSPETIRIAGKRIQLDGDVSMTTAWITKLYADSGFITNLETKTLNSIKANITSVITSSLASNTITSAHLKADDALIDKLFATSALIDRLTSKSAFISNVQAIDLNASRITAGTLNAANVNLINVNAGSITTGILKGITIQAVDFKGENMTLTGAINLDYTYNESSGVDPRRFNGTWTIQNNYIWMRGTETGVSDSALTGYFETYIGGDVLKFRRYTNSTSGVLKSRVDVHSSRLTITNTWNADDGFWAGPNGYANFNNLAVNGQHGVISKDGVDLGFYRSDQSTTIGLYAKDFVKQSQLSAKTNISELDQQEALETLLGTDILLYQYKSDVGTDEYHASVIIDDIHDAPIYRTPYIFTGADMRGRDDGTVVGYLVQAVKALYQKIKVLEEKVA